MIDPVDPRYSPIVTLHDDRVTRQYPPQIRRDRLAAEVYAYLRVPWAAPRLLWATEDTICVERCTPILDVPKDPAHARELRVLLGRIHAAGINHCDVAVSNVVLHPERGVLLIDWEVSIRAGQPLSYDLHGAAAAGLSWRPPEHQRPDGVWWGGPHDLAPAHYWREV